MPAAEAAPRRRAGGARPPQSISRDSMHTSDAGLRRDGSQEIVNEVIQEPVNDILANPALVWKVGERGKTCSLQENGSSRGPS